MKSFAVERDGLGYVLHCKGWDFFLSKPDLKLLLKEIEEALSK